MSREGLDVERDGSSFVRIVEIFSWSFFSGFFGRYVCVGFEVLFGGFVS